VTVGDVRRPVQAEGCIPVLGRYQQADGTSRPVRLLAREGGRSDPAGLHLRPVEEGVGRIPRAAASVAGTTALEVLLRVSEAQEVERGSLEWREVARRVGKTTA
jgi:hypothetical protein